MSSAWWDRESVKAKQKTNYHCIICGVHKSKALFHKWMEAHECYSIDYQKGTMTYVETISVCHADHSFIHRGRLEALYKKGQISKKKYTTIIERGVKIIRQNGLLLPPLPTVVAPWEQWVLVVGNRKFPGISKKVWLKRYS